MAMQQCVHFLGIPEGDLALAGRNLSVGRVSRISYRALRRRYVEVRGGRAEPVPMQLRNAVTSSMKSWGYSAGYEHAHKFDDAINQMDCLPGRLQESAGTTEGDHGVEQRCKNGVEEIRAAQK